MALRPLTTAPRPRTRTSVRALPPAEWVALSEVEKLQAGLAEAIARTCRWQGNSD